jgi:uncharacterized membrane protein YphA (DoxX/SURF4 family)
MDSSGETTVASVWRTLRLIFGLVPIVAGLDKFTNLLVYWPKYVAPFMARMLPMSPHAFMLAVGIIEIVAGLAVLFSPWPRVFGYVVAAWLTGIAINLIGAGYFDIAVRDLVMAATAVGFARLSAVVPQARHAHHPLEHARASG